MTEIPGHLRVAIRTDASLQIGTGHVMRCLTLAQALRERGAECRFICRAHPGHLLGRIREQGFEAVALLCDSGERDRSGQAAETALAHAEWLGADWRTDAEATRDALGEMIADWLVVDHYALDARWEAMLRPHCRKILVIDDLAEQAHDCDVLLNQNLGRKPDDYRGLVPDGCEVPCGPNYALLRPEFPAWRAASLDRRRDAPQLKRILVTMGGIDKDNATGIVLEALAGSRLPDGVEIDVVLGREAPWLQAVQEAAARLKWQTRVSVDVSNMAELMAESDFAIGAAGSTSWERCCIGLPSALVVLADNQAAACRELGAMDAAFDLGSPDDVPSTLPPVLDLIRSEPRYTRKMSEAAADICDGQGAGRVAASLMTRSDPINLRRGA